MHAFCWDPSKASEQEKLNHYADCSGAVCQKAVQIDGGGKCYNTIPPNNFRKKIHILHLFLHFVEAITAVARLCSLSAEVAQLTCKASENVIRALGCPNTNVDCLICNSDGCNGDATIGSGKRQCGNGAAQYKPIALLIALPVAIAKLISY